MYSKRSSVCNTQVAKTIYFADTGMIDDKQEVNQKHDLRNNQFANHAMFEFK